VTPPVDTPFAALTLLVAPAILTNASSVAILATSNRFARAVDRSRSLLAQIETSGEQQAEGKTLSAEAAELTRLRERQLDIAERRVLIIMRALKYFYLALGSFAGAAIISLLGAVNIFGLHPALNYVLSLGAFLAGATGVCGLSGGAVVLVWESQLTLGILTEEANWVRSRYINKQTRDQSSDLKGSVT